jgi:ketosteroid isomerase-like protein
MKSVSRWHSAVNSADVAAAVDAVTDPIVVNGPRGAGPVTPAEFADWVIRSGISLRPLSSHPFGDRVMVVAQEARWPDDPSWTPVATVFRVSRDGSRVSAALRFPDLPAALSFASLYAALAATENA